MENKDFLNSIYSEANNIYLSFVAYRFQVIGLFILNAAVFSFILDKTANYKLLLLISLSTIVFTWVMYFIDKRNQFIFRRAVKIANNIEIYNQVPENLRLHHKDANDKKQIITHSNLILFTTLLITIFWIIILIFPEVLA